MEKKELRLIHSFTWEAFEQVHSAIKMPLSDEGGASRTGQEGINKIKCPPNTAIQEITFLDTQSSLFSRSYSLLVKFSALALYEFYAAASRCVMWIFSIAYGTCSSL